MGPTGRARRTRSGRRGDGDGTRSLLRDRSFRRWMAAEVVNTLGSGVSAVVLPILVYARTGSAAQTGILAGLRVVPYLCFGLVAGPVADRVDRQRLLIRAIVLEGLAMASIPLVDAFTPVPIAQVYLASFLASTCFVFSDAAAFGALPAITGRQRLAAANGLLTAATSAALVVGPAIGAVLSGAVGPASAVWFDAATFAVAALLVAGIHVPFGGRDTAHGGVWAHAKDGLRFIRQERTILTLLLLGFVNSVAFGAVLGQIVVYADRALHVGDAGLRVGLLFTGGAVGTLIAGLAFHRAYATVRIRTLTPLGLLGAGMATLGLTVSSTYVVALGLYVVLSCAIQIVISTGITYRQVASPDDLVSSVNVVGRMVAWGGQPFGAMLGGLVSQIAGVRVTTGLAAAMFIGSAAAGAVALRIGTGPRPTRIGSAPEVPSPP